MRTARFMIAVGWCLAASCAEAQLQEQPTPPLLQSAVAPYSKLFANSAGPFPRLYQEKRANTTAFDTAFDSYRTDPKLMFGVELRPNLAVETGYGNLFSRGFHHVDYGRSDERAGALGTNGFSSYLAGKITVPVGDEFSTYGKLGIAYSQRATHDRSGSASREVDVGPYVNIGASYKLNGRASVSGELTRSGDTSNKWGGQSNATGASAKLKVGF